MPQDFQTILAAHAARYPEMAPQDYVKLAYQSEFGPAHLLPEGEECLQALRAEWAALLDTTQLDLEQSLERLLTLIKEKLEP